MEQRVRFVLGVPEDDMSGAAACRAFDIGWPTGYKWLERCEQEGIEGLEDRPSVPGGMPHETDEEFGENICTLRRHPPEPGPKKLRARPIRPTRDFAGRMRRIGPAGSGPLANRWSDPREKVRAGREASDEGRAASRSIVPPDGVSGGGFPARTGGRRAGRSVAGRRGVRRRRR